MVSDVTIEGYSRDNVRKKFLKATVLVALLLTVASFGRVMAANTPPPTQGIQISPVLIDLNAQKSNKYKLQITVTNVTAQDLVLKGNVNDFRAKDESGNPEVILDDTEGSEGFSFKKWVSVPQNISLKVKESKVVTVTVNVPDNAEAGGHYGVVRFTGVPPGEENSKVSIAASVGVLVLARVDGKISEKLSLKELYIEKDGKKSGLSQSGPLNIVERIENTGNVHVKPSGNVTVKNMFGGTVATLPLSEPARNVLPQSVRKFSQPLNKKWLFGRYTARVEVSYGYTNQVLSDSFTFWVIPYKLMLIVIISLTLVFFLIKTGLKRYNEKIINRAISNRR